MKGKYEAAFIVPVGTIKVLGSDGWEFESDNRLPTTIKKFLMDDLKLIFLESYQGIESYIGNNIKASVIHDDDNLVENIYFQVYGNMMNILLESFTISFIANDAELFIPRKSMCSKINGVESKNSQ